jgi:hypothetical protein
MDLDRRAFIGICKGSSKTPKTKTSALKAFVFTRVFFPHSGAFLGKMSKKTPQETF